MGRSRVGLVQSCSRGASGCAATAALGRANSCPCRVGTRQSRVAGGWVSTAAAVPTRERRRTLSNVSCSSMGAIVQRVRPSGARTLSSCSFSFSRPWRRSGWWVLVGGGRHRRAGAGGPGGGGDRGRQGCGALRAQRPPLGRMDRARAATRAGGGAGGGRGPPARGWHHAGRRLGGGTPRAAFAASYLAALAVAGRGRGRGASVRHEPAAEAVPVLVHLRHWRAGALITPLRRRREVPRPCMTCQETMHSPCLRTAAFKAQETRRRARGGPFLKVPARRLIRCCTV